MKTKKYVKHILNKTKAMSFASALVRNTIVILRYHSIQSVPERYQNIVGPTIIHSESLFEKQMEILNKHYNPITMDDVLLCLNKEKKIPIKAVVITFDDGFIDNYNIALPILEKYGIKASFFITTGSIGQDNPPWFCRLQHAFRTTKKKVWEDTIKQTTYDISNPKEWRGAFLECSKKCAVICGSEQQKVIRLIENSLDVEVNQFERVMMNWGEIESIRNKGHIIGSHTNNHTNLAYLTKKDLKNEIYYSKSILEEKLREKILHFSYPNPILEPNWNEVTIIQTKKAGYKTGVTCRTGNIHSGDNPMILKRISVPKNINEFRWSIDYSLIGGKV